MKVGYYPIKKSEIQEIFKMIALSKKEDISSIDEIINKYNVSSKKKDDILNGLHECNENKKKLCFNDSYGLCIAKVQKMYRGNFVFIDKSITGLIQEYPVFEKYTTNIEDLVKSKNNKYKFYKELRSENTSGVYMSKENVLDLYNAYIEDRNIKILVNLYYDNLKEKFIEVLKYAMDNDCGLLEANYTINMENNTEANNQQQINQNAATNNIQTNIPKMINGKRVTSLTAKSWTVIGWHVLMSLVVGLLTGIISLFIGETNSVVLAIIINFVESIITTFIIWKFTIMLAFIETTIEKIQIPKLMRNIGIYVVVLLVLSIFTNYKKLNNSINKEIRTQYDNSAGSVIMQIYGTQEEKTQYNEMLKEYEKKLKNEAMKVLVPYYVGISVLSIIINLSVLIYVRRDVKKVVDKQHAD